MALSWFSTRQRDCVEGGTFIRKTMFFPSGVHVMSLGDSVRRVTCVAGPSMSTYFTKICEPRGSPSATYAMREPSGDHVGDEPLSSMRLRVPSAFMIHTDVSHLSFTLSTQRRPKTICWPLGESDGACTCSHSR